MHSLLSGLTSYFQRQETTTDSPIFRMHCTFTTVLLVTFSLLITWTQFANDPIRCMTDNIPQHVVNTYCWITTTFTMPDAFNRPQYYAHDGIGVDKGDDSNKKYYTYYQWVYLVLLFQAMLFYFPKWLWDSWEGGMMDAIASGLNMGVRSEEDKNAKKGKLIEYLNDRWNQHNKYAFRYWFCELLCFVNVILQMIIMNWFFKGDFITYGWKVLGFGDVNQDDRVDHMVYVFPRVTKCTFRKFGNSQTIEKKDALCILPLNTINEKTYIFLWFWFIILAVMTFIMVVYRSFMIFLPSLRTRLMRASSGMASEKDIEVVARKVSVGDWWFLYILGGNMDPLVYKEVIAELATKSEIEVSSKYEFQRIKSKD
ncbi:Innexin inx1 [Orchesella cincta]|uniref:Innexin n=1 Tax=Orchesella cincta TaxID=48709 RepID=A0A1D2MTK2_ORCCI|nr:Innexin inx1 [Orchesella cincta]